MRPVLAAVPRVMLQMFEVAQAGGWCDWAVEEGGAGLRLDSGAALWCCWIHGGGMPQPQCSLWVVVLRVACTVCSQELSVHFNLLTQK